MKYPLIIGLILIPVLLVTLWVVRSEDSVNENDINYEKDSNMEKFIDGEGYSQIEGKEIATFATGCFWCMEAIMQEMNGVDEVLSGYAGGTEIEPTYEDVYTQVTGHREAVHVLYDPEIISYEDLLDVFWQNIDPTDPDGQFVDKGFSYTTAIFPHDEVQNIAAEKSLTDLSELGVYDSEIVTVIVPFSTFYLAEEYHQDYYKKSATRYNLYKNASGRDDFKKKVWDEIQKEEK